MIPVASCRDVKSSATWEISSENKSATWRYSHKFLEIKFRGRGVRDTSAMRTKLLALGGANPQRGQAPSISILQVALETCLAKGWGPPRGPLEWSGGVVPERFDPKYI
uniref:Uncharacterized protein n=1 Tax=Solanum tuberosum TaxID=4113 RepID=M1DCF1_SOLTU